MDLGLDGRVYLVTGGTRGRGLSGNGGRNHGPFGEKNFNCPERAVRSVVVTSCEDDDLCFGDDVDEAVLVVDPS
jgi:hypothetical protein